MVDDAEVLGRLLELLDLAQALVDDRFEAVVAPDLAGRDAGAAEGAAVDRVDGDGREAFADDTRLLAAELGQGRIDDIAHGHVRLELLLAVADEQQLGHAFERFDEGIFEIDQAHAARFRGVSHRRGG